MTYEAYLTPSLSAENGSEMVLKIVLKNAVFLKNAPKPSVF
jgi:hypothetical protein